MASLDLTGPFPTSLGECVDLYHDLRELRIAMEKEVALVAEREQAAKSHVLQRLCDEPGVTGVSGERYRAQRVERRVPKVTDWRTLHAWIAETGRFDVLQKRLLNTAIADMWESEQAVPGVEPAIAVDLSVTKI